MEPRIENQSKWTSLPSELVDQFSQALKERYPEKSKEGDFAVAGKIYSGEVILQITYIQASQLSNFNALASMDFDSEKQNALDSIYFLLDIAGFLVNQYFENPEEDFPFQWMKQEVEGQEVYFKINRENQDLEKQANELLGEDFDDEALLNVNEDSEEHDEEKVQKIKADLGLLDE